MRISWVRPLHGAWLECSSVSKAGLLRHPVTVEITGSNPVRGVIFQDSDQGDCARLLIEIEAGSIPAPGAEKNRGCVGIGIRRRLRNDEAFCLCGFKSHLPHSFAHVAQLAEHLPLKQKSAGSIPAVRIDEYEACA